MRVSTIAALVILAAAIVPAHEEVKNVKISLDWVILGTHAPFFVAQDKGYLKAEGITVDAIDKGNGATNVAVTVASGAYQYGWVDMPSMILFNAKNPSTPLVAVYVSFDQTPLAFITRKAAGIRTPADLDGKKIAGGPGIAVHDTASILFKAAHAENVKVNWDAVQPQLFAAMVKRGDVDGSSRLNHADSPGN